MMPKIKPRVFISIDTYIIGGPGKGLIQFLNNGGLELCDPLLTGFWRGPERPWQFREAVEKTGVRFEVLRQRHGFDPAVIKDALRLVRESNSVILQSHGYKAHILCLALSRITGLPWIAFVHGWTSENLKVESYNLLEKLVVRFADRIVPVSENLAQRLYLGRRGRAKTTVITNAVDLRPVEKKSEDIRERYGIKPENFLIGVVGRLSPEKGHRDFLDAMKIVTAQNSKVRAMFVGDGQERQALEQIIRDYGLGDKVILAGYQEDMFHFYRGFDVVVMPSHTEGMPNAALEAMIHGKPVIGTRVGGIPEVIVDGVTGCLVPPRNPTALAEAILVLVNNRAELSAYSAAGREKVEREFNPKKRVNEILSLYREVIRLNEQ